MFALLALAFVLGQAPASTPAGTIAAIRVQGNAVTTDDEVIRLSGLHPGDAFDAGTVARATQALKSSGRFARVQVLQRYASLSDPTALLIVIIVDEGPLTIASGSGGLPGIRRARGPHLLFAPVLGYEEGYGATYGARFAAVNPLGGRSRVSFPLTWGGDKRAGVDAEKSFGRGPFTRVAAVFDASRRTNPFFKEDDDRVRVAVRGERQIASHLNAGVSAGLERVSFFDARDRVATEGVDVTLDTRLDPMLARNALYARGGWSRVGVAGGVSANRVLLDGRVYVGLIKQSILVLRARHEAADRPLPLYLKPLLGGMDTLRGFGAGHAAGDNLFAGSAEILQPLTSPLRFAKFGVRAFVDAGAAYDNGAKLSDRTLARGVGGGIWFTATVLRLNLDVAHGLGASTRVHFGMTLNLGREN